MLLHRPQDADARPAASLHQFLDRRNDQVLLLVVQPGARHGSLRVAKAILHVHHQERRFLGFDRHIHSILLFLSLRGIGAAMLAL